MRFAETDIFVAEDRVELLDGVIIQRPQASWRHAHASNDLNAFFILASNDRYDVTVSAPLLLDDYSVPEPDLCLIDPITYSELKRHAGPEHVYLLIEIADATLKLDRTEKLRAYARQRIQDYWVLNLQDNILEVWREPQGDEFRQRRVCRANDTESPLAFPDLEVRIEEFLP